MQRIERIEIIDTDWLNCINGLTVANAIEYLSKLNQNHILSAYVDGGSYGAPIKSDLLFKRLETEVEAKVRIAEHKARLIIDAEKSVKHYQENLEYYLKLEDPHWIKEYNERLEKAKTKLQQLQNNS